MDPLSPSASKGGIALNDYQLSDPLIWILPIVKAWTRDATNCKHKVFGSSHTCDVMCWIVQSSALTLPEVSIHQYKFTSS